MQPPKLDILCPVTQEPVAGLALDRYLGIEYLDELSRSGGVAYRNDSRTMRNTVRKALTEPDPTVQAAKDLFGENSEP